MFTFLKLLEPFLLPPAIIAIAMLACLILLLAGKRKSGWALLALSLVVLYCLSTDFSVRPLIGSLTLIMPDPGRAFADPPDVSGAEAIVVLAGGVYRSGPQRPRPELAGTSWKRLWHGLELYWRFGGKLPLFYSGGSGDPFYPIGIEPGLAKEYLLKVGVPEKDIWSEAVSRNTFENVREVKRVLNERFPGVARHRIILVTSFIHMPRALLTMKKAGIEAIPAPADFPEACRGSFGYFSYTPLLDRFVFSTYCIREWIGIAGYRLMGRL